MSTILNGVNFGTGKNLDVPDDKLDMGGSFFVPTDVYQGVIKNLYFRRVNGAVQATIELSLLLPNGKTRDYSEFLRLSNDKGEFFYVDPKTGETQYYAKVKLLNALSIALLGKQFDLQNLKVEDKQVEVYNFDTKKKELTTVAVLTEFLGQKGFFAIRHLVKFKSTLVDGNWVESKDTFKEANEILYIGNPETKHTASELFTNHKNGTKDDASFLEKWKEKWKDVLIDFTNGAYENLKDKKKEPEKATTTPNEVNWN